MGMSSRLKYPKLTGYQVISLLLLTLVGLFLGVVSFTSFGVLNVTQEPITLLNTAIKKLDHIQEHQDVKDAEQQLWRNTVSNDHLFLSSLIASHDRQNADFAKQLNLKVNKTHELVVNGTDFIYNNTKIPIPPSALQYFKDSLLPTSFKIKYQVIGFNN